MIKPDINFNISFSLDSDININMKKMKKYYKNSDYYKSLVEGKPRRDTILYVGMIGNSNVYLRGTPGRYGLDKLEKPELKKTFNDKYGKSCTLYSNIVSTNLVDPISKELALLWRGYIIKPNTAPYFKTHFLIISSDYDCENPKRSLRGTQDDLHKTQKIIEDILDFYDFRKQKGFLFFNGRKGNSQPQFHFHYTTTKSILNKVIKKIKKMEYINYTSKIGTHITIFNSDDCPCYNGTIFFGEKDKVAKDVFLFIKKVSEDNYCYNIVIPPSSYKNKFQVIVFVRKDDPEVEEQLSTIDLIHPGMGANYGYIILKEVDNQTLKNGTLENDLFKYCKATYVNSNKKYFDL